MSRRRLCPSRFMFTEWRKSRASSEATGSVSPSVFKLAIPRLSKCRSPTRLRYKFLPTDANFERVVCWRAACVACASVRERKLEVAYGNSYAPRQLLCPLHCRLPCGSERLHLTHIYSIAGRPPAVLKGCLVDFDPPLDPWDIYVPDTEILSFLYILQVGLSRPLIS